MQINGFGFSLATAMHVLMAAPGAIVVRDGKGHKDRVTMLPGTS